MSNLFIPCEGYELSNLQANFFKLVFDKIPHVEFFCQSVQVPSVNFGYATQFASPHDLKVPGEKLVLGNLVTQILVDEKLMVYEEIYKWMYNLSVMGGATELVDDCTLQISNRKWHFKDVFPTQLTGFNVTSTARDAIPVIITVEFVYNYFTIIDEIIEPTVVPDEHFYDTTYIEDQVYVKKNDVDITRNYYV